VTVKTSAKRSQRWRNWPRRSIKVLSGTGIVDGADASTLAINKSIGVYDVAKHTTYPGFHLMSSDQLACRTEIWETVPEKHNRIIETAHKVRAADYVMLTLVDNGEALAALPELGVTTYDWSPEERGKFRAAAQEAWPTWAAKTPEAKMMVESHLFAVVAATNYRFSSLLSWRSCRIRVKEVERAQSKIMLKRRHHRPIFGSGNMMHADCRPSDNILVEN